MSQWIHVDCPYCGHRCRIQHDASRYLPTYNCDLDDGGCDSMFAVRVRIKLEANALKIEGEGEKNESRDQSSCQSV